jgi:hypothetical protein
MTNSYRRPSTPADVERQLRQEVGFGCARCGHPYLEYHHIIPFSEDEHFRPEDMIAVCPNCHGILETQGRDRQYEFKRSPHNHEVGEFRGLLHYDKRDLIFRVGGVWYENVPTILQHGSTPLISCRLAENQALVSINLFNSSGRIVLQVIDNEIAFRVGSFWDFECRRNVAIARSGPREIALKMDFSAPEATIDGRLWAGGCLVRLDKEHTNLGSNNMLRGGRMSNSPIGIQIG